jgi:hypothetical protein
LSMPIDCEPCPGKTTAILKVSIIDYSLFMMPEDCDL